MITLDGLNVKDLKANTLIVLHKHYFAYNTSTCTISDIVEQRNLRLNRNYSKFLILVEKLNDFIWICFCGGMLLEFPVLSYDMNKFTIYD